MHPCPVTHLVFADRYVPSDSSLPLPAAHSRTVSANTEIWSGRGRKCILPLLKVSEQFCSKLDSSLALVSDLYLNYKVKEMFVAPEIINALRNKTFKTFTQCVHVFS